MIYESSVRNEVKTVCAVVVTYNRKELLLECLSALLKQTRPVQAIYIIDNYSTDGTSQMLMKMRYISQLPPEDISQPWENQSEVNNLVDSKTVTIYYVRMNSNIGGAGGFYEGVKRAYQKGYDWLWLMDDDAEPRSDALKELANYFGDDKISALAGTVTLPDGSICFSHRGTIDFSETFPLLQKPLKPGNYNKPYVDIDMASFVGILINRKAIEKVGYPKKEFFIHHDDVEYCIRLRQVGRILLIPSSIIVHKEAAKDIGVQKTFLGRKSVCIPYEKLWIRYYGNRNIIWLGKKYSTRKVRFYLSIFKNVVRSIIKILIYDDNKMKRIRFVINYCLDGLKGRFDNEKPKKILYSS